MRKNRILSIAAGFLLACSVSLVQAQTDQSATLSADAQQDIQTLVTASQSGNPKDAENQLKVMKKKYKSDNKTVMAMAESLFQSKNYEQATNVAKIAQEADEKMIEPVLLQGDCFYAQHKYGEAATKYEEAVALNRMDKRAYFKLVNVYKYINPQTALEYMAAIKQTYPDDPEIFKTEGSIYYYQNDTTQAANSYSKYFSSKKFEEDVDAAREYAVILYLNKKYAESYDVVKAIIAKDPKEISLTRMNFYDLVELKKMAEAETASKTFFSLYADSMYNYNDYKTEGKLQSALKHIDKASEAFSKAAEKAPKEKQAELFRELSKAYQGVGKYDDAATAYQKFIDATNPESKTEMFKKGKIFYAAVGDTTLSADQKKHYIEEGSALFDKLGAVDSSYLGPFWSARINSTLDPNGANDVSKDKYNEALRRLEVKKDPEYNDLRVECLRYMSFYYLKKDDYTNSLAYAEKVLVLSPDDNLATQIKNAISKMKK